MTDHTETLKRLNTLDEKRKKALAEYQAFCDIEPPAAENTQKWSKLYCKKEKLERQIQDSGLQILALANRLAGELERCEIALRYVTTHAISQDCGRICDANPTLNYKEQWERSEHFVESAIRMAVESAKINQEPPEESA